MLWNVRPALAVNLRKGDHVLVEGTLVSNTYEWEARKGEKTTTVKQTSWSIRADAVRKLNRTDKEPEAIAPGSSQPAVPGTGVYRERPILGAFSIRLRCVFCSSVYFANSTSRLVIDLSYQSETTKYWTEFLSPLTLSHISSVDSDALNSEHRKAGVRDATNPFVYQESP